MPNMHGGCASAGDNSLCACLLQVRSTPLEDGTSSSLPLPFLLSLSLSLPLLLKTKGTGPEGVLLLHVWLMSHVTCTLGIFTPLVFVSVPALVPLPSQVLLKEKSCCEKRALAKKESSLNKEKSISAREWRLLFIPSTHFLLSPLIVYQALILSQNLQELTFAQAQGHQQDYYAIST
jgi:hypothetical protein